MSDLPYKATLKAGASYDSPWLTVDAHNVEDLEAQLQALLDSPVAALVVEAANLLKAANNAAPLATNGPDAVAAPAAAPARQTGGWSNQPMGGGSPAPSHPNAQTHPGGEVCDFAGCGKPLEYKKTQSGKGTWTCADWRWNGGTPNGHRREWAD